MAREIIRTRKFVEDAVGLILSEAELALRARSVFRIALSGGNTPRPVYAELARQPLPWDRTQFTFGDERCVPPDDEQSNYRMARETLFVPAHVPEESIWRMRGEIDPKVAAQEYEQQLGPDYCHDLILLGMGDDGHTASLFPGTAALEEKVRRVVANFAPNLKSWRITFTYPLINQARHVCFLADANKHRDLIDKVLGGDQQFPAARVNPVSGKLTWILGE